MKRKFLFPLAVIFLALTGSAFSQTIWGDFMLGSPQGEFRGNVNRLGYGFNFSGTINTPGAKPAVTFGLNLGYLIYGEESESRPFSNTNPDVYINADRTNSFLNYHLLVLVSPFTGTVRPYLEGLGGGAYISTKTSLKSEYNNQDIAESTNFSDHAWSYGGGAGLLFRVSQDQNTGQQIFIDVKARYIFGSNARYLKEGSMTIVNNRVIYDVYESRTDMLSFHIGVAVYL